MNCKKCNEKISLRHKPGVFLGFTLFFLAIFLMCWLQSSLVLMLASGFITLVSCGGVFTQMVDQSAHVYSDHQHLGVYCSSCNEINKIKPWSI